MSLIYQTEIGALFLCFLLSFAKKDGTLEDGRAKYRYSKLIILLFAALLIVVAGFRYKFADTTDYRAMHRLLASSADPVKEATEGSLKDVENGYLLFSYIISRLFNNAQMLFFISTAIIVGISVYTIKKYSDDLPYSLALYFFLGFISSMNGMRQLLAGVIVYLFLRYFINEKFFLTIIPILIAMTFHKSAMIFFFFYFMAIGKPFNKKLRAFLVLSVIMALLPASVTEYLASFLGEDDYAMYLTNSTGMSTMRFLVGSVPFFLCWLSRKKLTDKNDIFFSNLIVTDMCFNIIALRNLFFGRLSMYLTLVVCIMLPKYVRLAVEPRYEKLVKYISIILFAIYFVFQINAYGGMQNFSIVFSL